MRLQQMIYVDSFIDGIDYSMRKWPCSSIHDHRNIEPQDEEKFDFLFQQKVINNIQYYWEL